MESRAFCILMLCCFINVCNLHPLNIRPSNGLNLCRKNSSLPALEVLPGGGWDNLRNIDMGLVMNLSYSQCQTTEDGVYFIPDEVFVIPQKVSGVETNSEIITSWLEQKSFSSKSINAEVSFLSVLNAKFSTEKPAYENSPSEGEFCDSTSTSKYKSKKRSLIRSDVSSVSASAGLNFLNKVRFVIGSSTSHGTSETSGNEGNITYSLTESHGGALFYPGITLQKWQESTLNNLVAIDRSGLPIHYFLNPSTFPDLPVPTVNKMASSVSQAAEQYYKVNTIPGCINPDSPNFNFQANVDDASCEGPVTSLSFGGVYQRCTPLTSDGNAICDETAQKNPATGDYSCPQQYSTTLLRSETQSNSCPPNYFPQHFLSNGMMVCLSNDYEAGTRFSVPFAGFFSCQSGNPLAKGQNRCPPQFSQHLAAISDGCQILYCVQSGVFTGGELKPIRLPPFTRPPMVSMIATNTVAVMTEGDCSWVRVGETKMWRLAKPGEINQMASMFDTSSSQMSGGEKAGLAIGVMVLVALVIAGTVFIMKRRKRFSLAAAVTVTAVILVVISVS
uniref:Macrophage-expressed gene 1 protein n=1 Tax=Cyprinus carpio TaxID=7962 RepID=A0A8C2KHJ5_CYPCA